MGLSHRPHRSHHHRSRRPHRRPSRLLRPQRRHHHQDRQLFDWQRLPQEPESGWLKQRKSKRVDAHEVSQPAEILSVGDIDVVFCRVVVVVDFDQDVAIVDFNTDTIDVFNVPIDRDWNALSSLDTYDGFDIERIFRVTCKECNLELRCGWSTVVNDSRRDFDIGSWRHVIVRDRDRLDSQFWTNSPEAYPLTLKVRIIEGQFRDWTRFELRRQGIGFQQRPSLLHRIRRNLLLVVQCFRLL